MIIARELKYGIQCHSVILHTCTFTDCTLRMIQSNEFRRVQVILYAHISIRQHLYTNWLTSSSSQVSVEIKQNLLNRPVFIEFILKGINSITLHHSILTILVQNANFLKL